MGLNTDPWSSVLVDRNQALRYILAHPCSYFCGQNWDMIQALANIKDILHKQQEKAKLLWFPYPTVI